jgi:hypothetical protein
MSIEAMKQALESLIYVISHGVAVQQAKDILLEAIEQAERQEVEPDRDCVENDGCPTEKAVLQRFWRKHQQAEKPVAWWHDMGDVVDLNVSGRGTPLYTAPPQRSWQGLTDEEVRAFEVWLDDEEEKHGWNPPQDIIKYIESKLKEKNNG